MSIRPGLLEILHRTRRRGLADSGRRVLRRLSAWLDVQSLDFPLLPEDIADSTRLRRYEPADHEVPSQLTVGWICTPPAAGSGGHTTLFRMVEGMEKRGHRSVLFLYDRHGGDLARHTAVIRQHWPNLKAEIRDATTGLSGVDAYVATSWETAHVLASRATDSRPCLYFIQDFEPFFYPRGTLQALAEDTYRFGFTNIALGEMVASELRERGIDCVVAPFGCDTSVYSLTERGPRSGVVFYAKRGADRRGFLLARRALEEFHTRHPEQTIHVYGDSVGEWAVPCQRHERLRPEELNDLYNRTLGGLALSFTNISLVAEEMLAAGAICVVNDSRQSRADLANDNVVWAVPTAGGIADALCRVVEHISPSERSRAAAGSVRHGWQPAEEIVARAIVSAVEGARVISS